MNSILRLPIAASLIVAAVVTMWFATAPKAEAVLVYVCHKRVLTIQVVFGSLDYRRHKDHGDTDGQCPSTVSNDFFTPNRVLRPMAPNVTTNR